MISRQTRSMSSSLTAVVTMTIGVGLLGLAVLRWRQNGAGALVWLAALLVMLAIRTPHTLRNRRNVVVDARKDVAETALLAAMFLTMMVLPLLHLATGAFGFADYRLPSGAIVAGALLQVPCLWLFWRSHADLGRNWSPGLEVREDHSLITRGVYARIRHPMYAAIWISVLAQPLLIQNWIAGFLVAPAFAAMWFIRVPKEEAMMRLQFGKAWEAYCVRAGRLLPRWTA